MTVRVRQILSALNSVERTELKKLLPPKLRVPEEPEGTKYPASLLSVLATAAPGEQYSLTGFISEDLLAFAPIDVTPAKLTEIVRARCPAMTDDGIGKLLKSKTTDIFLDHIRETRKKLRFAACGALRHEEAIGNAVLEGHPDYRTDTQIFEVKMTGQLKQNWQDFLFQVFAYAALAPEITDVYLVLPLQEIVWHHSVRAWTTKAEFRAYLETAIAKKTTVAGPTQALVATHRIGSHMPKLKSLPTTIHVLPTDRPSQIFLCGPQSSRLHIEDDELAAAAAAIAATGVRLFIHSPYIINLCTVADAENEAYHTRLLIKNLQYGAIIGARGVVVHVGKSTTQTLEAAMAAMKANMLEAIQHATPACPILLETPAGQGTEVLRTWAEFSAFVTGINDPRLRICIDTCHVFACGSAPLEYVKAATTEQPGLTKLIHFNDSAAACGSCLDRHAAIGNGHIGFDTLAAIAAVATAHGIPMVIE